MTRAFAARYAARWNGEVAEIHGANTYDGTQMLMIAMEAACPNLTGETIAAEFHKICGYKGLQGEFCVTETGETLTETMLGVIKGGKLTIYTGQ
jgi:ABC-type branched-subunit amino acid transport system substrate-binding protein